LYCSLYIRYTVLPTICTAVNRTYRVPPTSPQRTEGI